MRGKHCAKGKSFGQHRITPADAGKTILFRQQINLAQDHPRGCGENFSHFIPF